MGKMQEKKAMKFVDAKAAARKQQSGFSLDTLNLPKGVNLFGFRKEGIYSLDIIPYIVGRGNPLADEGYVHYERTLFSHKNIGVENKQFACLTRNWGEPCPICEYREEIKRKGAPDDTVKPLYPKKRQIMAVIDLEDKDKGIQIYEGPYNYGLGEKIDNKLDVAKEGSPKTRFYHPTGGMTLQVSTKSKGFNTPDGGSGKFIYPFEIEMEPRDIEYDAELTPCLDDLLNKPDYKKLKDLFHKGADNIEEEEENKEEDVSRNGSSKSSTVSKYHKDEDDDDKDDDDDDDKDDDDKDEDDEKDVEYKVGDKVNHSEYGVCTVLMINEDGKLKIKDKEGNIHRAVKPSEVKSHKVEEEKKPDIRSLKTPKKNDEEE